MVKYLCIPLSLTCTVVAQDFSKQLDYVASRVEKESFEDLIALWDYYYYKPIDLNNSDEIEQLPLLNLMSEMECRRIQTYCQNRKLISIYELQGLNIKIESLKRIKKFIRVSTKKRNKSSAKKKSFFAGTKYLTQKKLGHTNRTYQGSRFKTHFRIRMQMKKGWVLGLNWEKDPGEPMWYENDGPNNLGGYVSYKGPKKLQKIILGKYDINLGEGLLFGTSYRINNPYFISYSPTITVKETLSSKEHRYFQGVSTQWGNNALKLGLFISHRKLHGNKKPDKSGLYRSVKEIRKRKKIRERILGVWISKKINKGKLSWSGILYETKKKKHLLQSLYISKNYFNINYSGEIATQNFEFWATLQKLNISISNNSLLSLQYRNRDYGTFNTYKSDYSRFSNGYENGFLCSFQHVFDQKWRFNATFDHYYPNYGENKSYEILSGEKISVAVSKATSSRKVVVKLQKISTINTKTINKLKLFYQENLNSAIRFSLKGNYTDNAGIGNSSFDYKLDWTNPNKKSKLSFSYGIFNTSNQIVFWESPYFYGSYNSRFIMGKGNIYSMTCQKRWSKSIKYGIQLIQQSYADRQIIGTGNERINSNSKTELSFYLKWMSD